MFSFPQFTRLVQVIKNLKNDLVPSWCRRPSTRRNSTSSHKPISFIWVFFHSFVFCSLLFHFNCVFYTNWELIFFILCSFLFSIMRKRAMVKGTFYGSLLRVLESYSSVRFPTSYQPSFDRISAHFSAISEFCRISGSRVSAYNASLRSQQLKFPPNVSCQLCVLNSWKQATKNALYK